VRHSQSSSTPLCGDGEVKLWDGYSMLHIEGNGKAHHQDLGQLTFKLPKLLRLSISQMPLEFETSRSRPADAINMVILILLRPV